MKKSLLLACLCLIGAARAIMADETPAAPAPVPAEVRSACEADVAKLCAGVQPGGGRIMQCLAQHKTEVSDGCKQAIAKARQGKT
jgi:Cysteine rich repeat